MPFLTQRLPRRLWALLLALSLFAPAASFGQVLYSCAMSGQTSRGACCCHRAKLREATAERAQGISPGSKAERPGCCRAEEQRQGLAASATHGSETGAHAAWLVELLRIELPPPLAAVLARVRAEQPPSRGDPLFAQNCALLL